MTMVMLSIKKPTKTDRKTDKTGPKTANFFR